jgi:hypothetical protein
VLDGERLYGRGGADDGYAVFAAVNYKIELSLIIGVFKLN